MNKILKSYNKVFCKQPEHMLVSRDFVHYENQQLILVPFIKYVTGVM